MNKKIAMTCGLVVVLSTAVSLNYIKNNSEYSEQGEILTEMYSEVGTFSSDKYKEYEAVVKDFDLGKLNFDNAVDIDIKGMLSYPKEKENAPIVIVLAGNENVVKDGNVKDNLYKGYDYLVRGLAESGFMTLVIDTQFKDSYFDENEIVEDKILEELYDYHLKNLEKSISGEEDVYGVDMQNKGDLEKIGLVGQSSTAKTIFNISNKKIDSEDASIKGLLSITPGESLSVKSTYPDIPTSVLVAEHSLDTTIGFDIYNEIERDTSRDSYAGLTYMIGADSKQFNSRIEEDKILKAKVTEIAKRSEKDSNSDSQPNSSLEPAFSANIDTHKSVAENTQDIISEENILKDENTDLIQDVSLHENFLSSYTVSYFKSVFGEDDYFKDIYLGIEPSPSKMYGVDVMNKYYNPKKEGVYSSDLKKTVKYRKIKEQDVIESNMSDMDTAINFNEPTTNIELKLKKMTWEKEFPLMSVSLKGVDCSKYNAIDVRWAIDSASSLNINPQKVVSVKLKDAYGATSTVVLSGENALRKMNGKEKNVNDGKVDWSRYTPLSDSRIPLSLFDGVDLKNLDSLTLSFENSKSGSIYIDEIFLVK